MLAEESVRYQAETPLTKRKALGQYMTPTTVSDLAFKAISIPDGATVLDPAVGTGELLRNTLAKYPTANLNLVGWDVDPEILKVAAKLVPTATLVDQDSLAADLSSQHGTVDVIIGNPPYFEMKKQDIPRPFVTASGRPNIYALFFEVCLPLLKEDGVLAFIVPPSMNAGAYFAPLRRYILENADVTHLDIVRANQHFTDALTSVQIIVLRKVKQRSLAEALRTPGNHVLDLGAVTGDAAAPVIFTHDAAAMRQTWTGCTSLHALGYEAVTGTIPWNQYKSNLFATEQPNSAKLFYAKDIAGDNTLRESSLVKDRRFLVSAKPRITGKALLVNRIVGGLDNPRIKVVLADGSDQPFYAENHLNVIRVREGVKPGMSIETLLARLTGTAYGTYLQSLTGSTQLSARELTYLLPVKR